MDAFGLLRRRVQLAKWLFGVAAVPASLVVLIGAAYGAFLPYAVLAAVCIVQMFYPTLIGLGGRPSRCGIRIRRLWIHGHFGHHHYSRRG